MVGSYFDSRLLPFPVYFSWSPRGLALILNIFWSPKSMILILNIFSETKETWDKETKELYNDDALHVTAADLHHHLQHTVIPTWPSWQRSCSDFSMMISMGSRIAPLNYWPRLPMNFRCPKGRHFLRTACGVVEPFCKSLPFPTSELLSSNCDHFYFSIFWRWQCSTENPTSSLLSSRTDASSSLMTRAYGVSDNLI